MSEKNVLELELERLRRQNRRLKKRLAARQEIESGKDTPESELETVRLENESLRRSLKRSKELEDDIAAQKLFEKAKSLLVTWLTIGGATVAIAGILGFMKMEDYATTLVDKRLTTVTDEAMNRTIQNEAQKQVTNFIQQKQDSLNDLAQKKILEIVSLQPMGRMDVTYRDQGQFIVATASHVDYTSEMTPIRDQGTESSVGAFALAAAMEYQILKKTGKKVVVSPREIYYLGAKESGLPPDTGLYMHDAIKVINTTGAVLEEAWPYQDGQAAAAPPASLQSAQHFRMQTRVIRNLSDLKSALQFIGPAAVSLNVWDSILKVGKDGIIPALPQKNELSNLVAFCAVGFDDQKKLVKFKVSWGSSWGDHGYAYFPYDYLNKNMTNESYALSY